MELAFRRAEPDQIDIAHGAYRRIIDHLAETVDYTHWHTVGHPRPQQIEDWVRAGELYFALSTTAASPVTDPDVAGVVVLNHEAPAAYRAAAWSIEASDDEVLVLHALGVDPDHLRRGVARYLVDSALDAARRRRLRAVRLDTHVENLPARELYRRYGFTELGPHELRYEGIELDRFHLFEYVL